LGLEVQFPRNSHVIISPWTFVKDDLSVDELRPIPLLTLLDKVIYSRQILLLGCQNHYVCTVIFRSSGKPITQNEGGAEHLPVYPSL
jgi:hypothetical protein